MTRQEIADDLLALVVEIGNSVGTAGDDPVVIARRAYVRGLASHAILQLRDRVLPGAPVSPADLMGDLISPRGPSL